MDDERRRRIERRAHAIWEEQGRPHGRHEDHWRQAEREIGDEGDGRPDADPVPRGTPMAQPGAQGTGGMGSDAGAALGGSTAAGGAALTGGLGADAADAGAAASGEARALRGGPQKGAVDTGGSELGSQSDLD